MIPKIVHYVWLGGKEMPEEYKNYINGWKKLMPDWQFMEWNESNFDFSDCTYAKQAYEMKKFAFASDYVRVCVLEEYGGVYLDTDVELLKPLDCFLDTDFFTCFETAAYVQMGIVGGVAHHPIWQAMRRYYAHCSFLKKNRVDSTPNPLLLTYILMKDFGFKMKHENQVLSNGMGNTATILLNEYFAPIDYTSGVMTKTENTFAIHHFAGSWTGKKESREHAITVWALNTFGRRMFSFFTRCYVRHIEKQLWQSDKKYHYSFYALALKEARLAKRKKRQKSEFPEAEGSF